MWCQQIDQGPEAELPRPERRAEKRPWLSEPGHPHAGGERDEAQHHSGPGHARPKIAALQPGLFARFAGFDAAEAAFRRIVALGLATNALSVKFLFRPSSTDFLPDPTLSAPYALWLRAIGREAAQAGVCLSVIGHTSRTGSETFNDRLSLQRAQAMLRRLEQAAPELRGRLQASGVGFRENLVGSGTDDARDAARPVAPLMKLPDAALLDTTERNVDEAVAFVLDLIKAGRKSSG